MLKPHNFDNIRRLGGLVERVRGRSEGGQVWLEIALSGPESLVAVALRELAAEVRTGSRT